MAALAAYPELSCTGGPFSVETRWGIFDDVYCAGSDGAIDFLEKVLDEVIELFPSQFFHIGGDECPKTRWKTCERCQARMRAEGLKRAQIEVAQANLRALDLYVRQGFRETWRGVKMSETLGLPLPRILLERPL